MAVDLSRMARTGTDAGTGTRSRRPWHGAAFIVESLVLLAFLMTALAIMAQLMGAAHERAVEAQRLSNAIVLASNEAEAFAASPDDADTESAFELVDGQLASVEGAGAGGDAGSAGRSGLYRVERVVEMQDEPAGTLYVARITVSCDGEDVYALDTSRYVPDTEVQR